MATKKRLIDVNKVIDAMQKCLDESPDQKESLAYFTFESIIECLKQEPTVDAVEVGRLGKLGRLMLPYSGCPRGPMGPRGFSDSTQEVMELDPVVDVDGNRWVPVLEQDLYNLKSMVTNARQIHHSDESCKKGLEEGKPKWIPVTRRLPDSDGIFLVYFVDDDGIKHAWYGEFKKPCNWFTYDIYGDSWSGEVTHWMPRPEPPKEVE